MKRHDNGRTALLHVFFAVEIALLVYILTTVLTYTTYISEEDGYIMRALAGCFADRPMVWVPYISPLLARLLSLLCTIIPSTSCYSFLQRLLILASMAVINTCVFQEFRKHISGREYIPGIIASVVIDGILAWTLARMHRYNVAAVTCAAAVAVLLTADFKGGKLLLRSLLALALFFFSVGFAPQASVGMLCLLLLAVAYRALPWLKSAKTRGRALRGAIALCLILILFVTGSTALFNREQNRLNGPEYGDWEAARSAYENWKSAAADGEEADYESVGWSEAFYQLTQRSYNMDERFDTHAVSEILVQNGGSFPSLKQIISSEQSGEGSANSMREAMGLLLAMVGLLLGCALLVGRVRRPAWTLFAILGCIAYSIAMCIAAVLRRQFTLPCFGLAIMPCVVFLSLVLADCVCRSRRDAVPNARERAKGESDGIGRALTAVVAIAVALGGCGLYAINSLAYLRDEANRSYYDQALSKAQVLTNYAARHPSELLVYDSSAVRFYTPFPDLKTGELQNLIAWGGSGARSYPYNEQVRLNRLASLTSADFSRRRVRFISDSEESIELLLRHLNAEYGIQACVITDELQDGLLVVNYLESYNFNALNAGQTAPARVLICDGGQISVYTPGQSDDTKEQEDRFKIFYHVSDGPSAVESFTTAESRVPVSIKTMESLIDLPEGKRFAGWRAYRTDTRCWRVLTSSGVAIWAKAVPEGGSYYLYPDGAELLMVAWADAEVHLYAQWDNCFTIYYHRDIYSRADARTTQVPYGKPTSTLSYNELGFARRGMSFLGWRVYRKDLGKWMLVNSKGETYWSRIVPESGKYYLFKNEDYTSTVGIPNSEIHFFADWQPTDTFTVYYHQDDDSPASAATTKVIYGDQKTQAKTMVSLGYYTYGKRFVGWKLYRSDKHKWYVMDADGNAMWAEEPPENGCYWLAKDRWTITKSVPPGYELHLYAQWADTDGYTVFYHIHDGMDADELTSFVRKGEQIKVLKIKDLGFAISGYHFKGWKVFRTDTRQWMIKEESGKTAWKASLPNGATYFLGKNGMKTPTKPQPGTELHLYAQWEKDEES